MRDSFVFYRSFAEALKALPEDVQGKILNYIVQYALDEKEPDEETGVAVACFRLIKPQIDANNKRFENGCKGAEFGKLGGAPKGNQNARKQPKQPQNNPETTRNVNDNVNVNDNDKYINPKIIKWGGKQRTYDFEELTEEIKIK